MLSFKHKFNSNYGCHINVFAWKNTARIYKGISLWKKINKWLKDLQTLGEISFARGQPKSQRSHDRSHSHPEAKLWGQKKKLVTGSNTKPILGSALSLYLNSVGCLLRSPIHTQTSLQRKASILRSHPLLEDGNKGWQPCESQREGPCRHRCQLPTCRMPGLCSVSSIITHAGHRGLVVTALKGNDAGLNARTNYSTPPLRSQTLKPPFLVPQPQ